MARRTKSYFAKSNRGKAGAVFVNNVIANSQKRKKQEAKAAEAASRRRAREAERERARRAKEEERKRIQLEKEAERKRKEKAKLDAKENAVSERLKLEFPKAGLYHEEHNSRDRKTSGSGKHFTSKSTLFFHRWK